MADFADDNNRYEGKSVTPVAFLPIIRTNTIIDERNYDRRSASPRGDRDDRNRSRSPIDRDRV